MRGDREPTKGAERKDADAGICGGEKSGAAMIKAPVDTINYSRQPQKMPPMATDTPRTDELKLIPTVLAVIATGSCTNTTIRQSSADARPTLYPLFSNRNRNDEGSPRAKLTTAPEQPSIVKMTTSQRIL